MVLEHLFTEKWLEQKFWSAFVLGLGYSLIGILLARMLFGANSGLASVIFTSLLLIPSLRKLFKREELLEEKERSFSLKKLFVDNKHLIRSYLGIFLGVYVMYFLISSVSMYFGMDTVNIFKEQLFLDPAISGRAAYEVGIFWNILANNWWVLLACFMLSLISGNGATFFVVWNASAWATIFGVRAIAAASVLGTSSVGVVALMQGITLPHIILEGGAYILAGIAGAVISDDVISESKDLGQFVVSLIFLMFLFVFFNKVLIILAGSYIGLLTVLRMVVIVGLVYLLRYTLTDKKHKEVFTYNYWLFLIAIAVFVIGALVETGVLSYSGLLNTYYTAAMQFFI